MSGTTYAPLPAKDKQDVESGFHHPSNTYNGQQPSAPPYQPSAPSWGPTQSVYQPFPTPPSSYAAENRYHYGYAPPGPTITSDYPILGSYQPGSEAFVDMTIRQGFKRKVLGLVSLQLLLTTLIAGAICFSHYAQQQLQAHPGLFWLTFGASIAIMLVMMCNEGVRRRYPLNLLLLFGFTAAEGLLIGIASSQYDTDLVVLAFALTAGLTACLAVAAIQTKVDLTAFGGILLAASCSLLGVSLIYIFFPYWKPAELCISGFGALLFAAYIMYDIQLVVGGDHSVQVSPEEYIFAAMNIYMDIINLFLYILRFMQALRDD